MSVDDILNRFVRDLRDLSPSKSALIAAGYLDNTADEVLQSYVCKRREAPYPPTYDDPLLELHRRYDLSTVSLAGITFEERSLDFFAGPLQQMQQIPIAMLEVDPLVLCRTTGEIVQVDHAKLDRIMARWAASSEKFLNACLLLMQYEAPHGPDKCGDATWAPTKDEFNENNATAHEWGLKCARVAGISESESAVYEALIYTYRQPKE